MPKKMLIDATHAEETRVVVVDGNKVEEFDFESQFKRQLAGNIYLAKVTRVEPSLQAAFIDYGGNRHGFLAFSEIHPDYYQIPVADREALIAEEKAYADSIKAQDEEDEKPKSKRRRSRAKPNAAVVEGDDAVVTADPSADPIETTEDVTSGDIAGMETIDLGSDDDDAVDPSEGSSPMETVAECYPSPGASSTFFYIYVGLADLPDTFGGSSGGLASEAEDIRSHLIDFDVLMKMTETFAARNAPLVLTALWLARHRDRLGAIA